MASPAILNIAYIKCALNATIVLQLLVLKATRYSCPALILEFEVMSPDFPYKRILQCTDQLFLMVWLVPTCRFSRQLHFKFICRERINLYIPRRFS